MKILTLDTTTIQGSVGFVEGDNLIAWERSQGLSTHSEVFFPLLQKLFDRAGWKVDELQGIAVALGPGSFTGLRIGLAAAKGLAFSLGIPIAGVSSLEALALAIAAAPGDCIAPLIDARRGEFYGALFQVHHNFLVVLDPPAAHAPTIWHEKIAALPQKTWVVGEGEEESDRPHPLMIARLAEARLKMGGDDIAALVPHYIRPADASIRR